MIKLLIQDFQWILGPDDDPEDQCAHGRVLFRINDTDFVKPEDGVFSISGSGLFLLRTLSENHTAENSVAEYNFIFPCCAFSFYLKIGSRFKVDCVGCNNGIDLEIIHQNDSVVIRSAVASEVVTKLEWTRAVLNFADSVRGFYRSSLPKVAIKDEYESKGWSLFWQEWDERYQLATNVLQV